MKHNRKQRRAEQAIGRKGAKRVSRVTTGLQAALETLELLPWRIKLRIVWQILTKKRTKDRARMRVLLDKTVV